MGDGLNDLDGFWRALDLSGDPHLVLGKRSGRSKMEAVDVPLHSDIHDAFRNVCSRAIERVCASTARPYEPTAEIERSEEYFVLRIDELPKRPPIKRPANAKGEEAQNSEENPDRTASLVSTLRSTSRLQSIDAHRPPEFNALFYSIAWQQSGGGWVHFIRKSNPRQYFKPGRIWTQFGDALRRTADPAMAIDDEVDVIFTDEVLAGFSSVVVKNLFTDVHLVMRDVPQYVARVSKLLLKVLPLEAEAAAILEKVAHQKFSVASRLYSLPERLAVLELSCDRVREVLDAHQLDPDTLLSSNDTFSFGEENVGVFLDVLEGRIFADDWTGESRRADRFSRLVT